MNFILGGGRIYRQPPEKGSRPDSREPLGVPGSPAVLFDVLRYFLRCALDSEASVSLGFSGHPESAFLSAVSLASGFTAYFVVVDASIIFV